MFTLLVFSVFISWTKMSEGGALSDSTCVRICVSVSARFLPSGIILAIVSSFLYAFITLSRTSELADAAGVASVASDGSGDDKDATWLAWKHLFVHEAGFSTLIALDCSAFRYRLVDGIKSNTSGGVNSCADPGIRTHFSHLSMSRQEKSATIVVLNHPMPLMI